MMVVQVGVEGLEQIGRWSETEVEMEMEVEVEVE
jgi:hypothetical protein